MTKNVYMSIKKIILIMFYMKNSKYYKDNQYICRVDSTEYQNGYRPICLARSIFIRCSKQHGCFELWFSFSQLSKRCRIDLLSFDKADGSFTARVNAALLHSPSRVQGSKIFLFPLSRKTNTHEKPNSIPLRENDHKTKPSIFDSRKREGKK